MSVSQRTLPSTSGEEIVDLLTRLVGFPTESRSSNLDLIGYYADRVTSCGGRVQVMPGDEGRANLLVSFGPEGHGGVLLSGHTDVVPAGTGWASDPYRLMRHDGAVHGRGTADMKGFLATALHVLEHTDLTTLVAPVYLALSYDEEIGCVGVRSMLTTLVDEGVRPELVIVGEPTGMRVCNAHSGKAAFEVSLHGRSNHSFLAHRHPSAVVAAAELAVAIDGIQRAADARPGADDGAHRHVSTNVGTITGGVAVNVMAARAELTFEVRHSADIDVSALLDPIWLEVGRVEERLAAIGGRVDVAELSRYPALHTDASHETVERLGRLVDTGPVGVIGYGSEGGLYAETLGAPVVICGPGHITDAHRPDEFVTLEQLERCRRMIVQTVQEFCTDKEVQ